MHCPDCQAAAHAPVPCVVFSLARLLQAARSEGGQLPEGAREQLDATVAALDK